MNHHYGYLNNYRPKINQGMITQNDELQNIKNTLSQLTNKDIPIILDRLNKAEQQLRGIYGQLNQTQQDLTAVYGRLGRCNC